MMMKRNCNLELRLVTPSVFFHSSHHDDTSYHSNMLNNMEGESPNQQQQQQQQLTIFYNGRVAACDATELQARAIILLASGDHSSSDNNGSTSNVMSRPIIPTTGLSMKRSLQRFLEKRKTRLHSSSPYPISTTTTHHN